MFFSNLFGFLKSFFFQSPQPEPEPPLTIAGIVTAQKEQGQFETLFAALTDPRLDNGLLAAAADETADVTVFAPTDEAFRATARDLGVEQSVLDGLSDGQDIVDLLISALGAETVSTVLQYHVSGGGKTLADLDGAVVTTLATPTADISNTFTVTPAGLEDADTTIEDPEFIEDLTDIQASNGVIQAIDRVLLPTELMEPEQPTIAAIAAGAPEGLDGFSALVAALSATSGVNGLLAAASDPNANITVFAPTNAAFLALANQLGAGLDEDADGGTIATAIVTQLTAVFEDAGSATPLDDAVGLVSDILAYHVILDDKRLSDLNGDKVAETALDGQYLAFDETGIIDADSDTSPEIVAPDLDASNGVIQVIDQVLFPLDLMPDDNVRERGSRSDDVIDTGSGDDFVFSRSGDDVVITNDGDDYIRSGSGDDIVIAGAGDDIVFLGRGEDLVIDGAGDDRYYGGRGVDTFEFTDIAGDNTVLNFGRSDVLVFSSDDFATAEAVLAASSKSFGRTEIDVGDASVMVRSFITLDTDNIEII